MALEAIQEVTRAEARAEADREEAAAQAKQALADARKQGRQLAEEKAARLTRETLDQAARDCEAMKAEARGRLDETARWIAEKVVRR